ncbi:hypothetical protein SALBM217S_05368 [Streptomyces griseoloalbus]
MFAVLNITHGMNEILALVLAILTGTVAGAIHGFIFARIGVPAFAVTLAGLLFWQGFMLQILGDNGTINLFDSEGLVVKLTSYYFSDVAAAYGLALLATVAYFLAAFSFDNRRREAAGVPSRPLNEIIVRTVLLAILAFAVAVVFNQYKGLPLAVVIFLAFLVLTDFVLRRTSYGRKVFALGGSVEASRRAGINVEVIRISVFAIAGTFAAMGGLFVASKIASANQGAGTGEFLMNVIAAAVMAVRRSSVAVAARGRAARCDGHRVHPVRAGAGGHCLSGAVHDHRWCSSRHGRHRRDYWEDAEDGGAGLAENRGAGLVVRLRVRCGCSRPRGGAACRLGPAPPWE